MDERQRCPDSRRHASKDVDHRRRADDKAPIRHTPVTWFVDAMASELGLGATPADRRTLRLLRRLSDWAMGEGFPLDPGVILDPDTVERFVEVGLADDRSRATYRAVLRRVGPLLTTRAPWEPRPASRRPSPGRCALHRRGGRAAAPAALGQPTDRRRRAARALLALGLGAGLDGRWVHPGRGP